jgi:hypothetical protein
MKNSPFSTLFLSLFTSSILLPLSMVAENLSTYHVKASWIYGNILKHTRHLEQTVKGPTMGAALSVEWPTMGSSKEWPALYQFPDVGVSATVLNLGNDSIFGNLAALTPYLRFKTPLAGLMNFHLKTGVGISYLTKTFQDARYYNANGTLILGRSNAAIGSHLNVFFALEGELSFSLGKQMEIISSLSWNHASNGSFYQPNSGLNMVNAGVGLRYRIASKSLKESAFDQWSNLTNHSVADEYVQQTNDTIRHYNLQQQNKELNLDQSDFLNVKIVPVKKWGAEFILSGGTRELYYRDEERFATGAFTFLLYSPVSKKLRVGVGIDTFYDAVFSAVNSATNSTDNRSRYKRTYLTQDELSNRFRSGISLQPELIFGKLIAGFHFGIYVFNPIKNLEPYNEAKERTLNKGIIYPYNIEKEDGWLYTRASLKYSLSPHLLMHLGLKTHLQKAEFIEWGLGYRL